VKIGTTAAQKKLFFNLRKIKGQIDAIDEGDLRPEQVKLIADKLGVEQGDVIEMNRRMMGGEASLNAPLGNGDDSGGEWQDWLVDENAVNAEQKLASEGEFDLRLSLLERAMETLNERERHIITERRLKDEPATLEDLSKEFGVSRERVRQIEARAFEKLQQAMKRLNREAHAETLEAADA
jgi:RNA polymerase sigma-32 factor